MAVGAGLESATQAPNAAVAIQPGLFVTPVCVVDSTGAFVESAGATVVSGTVAVSSLSGSVLLFRDAQITAQASTAVLGPSSGTVVATVTPGVAGLWEVSVTVSASGTTVGATDSNNMALYQTSTARLNPISYVVATAGSNFQTAVPSLILSLSAADTVNVKALASATGTATYIATIVCRRVG